jgi:hypothetical protein
MTSESATCRHGPDSDHRAVPIDDDRLCNHGAWWLSLDELGMTVGLERVLVADEAGVVGDAVVEAAGCCVGVVRGPVQA